MVSKTSNALTISHYSQQKFGSASKSAKALTCAQQLADPLQQALAEGCHLRRDPEHDILRTFGQDNVKSERFVLSSDDILPPHFLLSPHLIGVATKT